MKESSSFFLLIFFLLTVNVLCSCTGNASFTESEIRFTEAFKQDQIIVFRSSLGQIDKIKFYKRELNTIKYRNLSQGFYNENILRVRYQLLDSSYHKIDYGAGLSNYELIDNYLSFLKSKNGHSNKEINFLGLEINESYIENLINKKDSVFIFRSEDAQYKNININEGIQRFTFSLTQGVVSFIDKHGVEWKRID